MSNTNDGGPAFPQPATSEGLAANTPWGIAGAGLSTRDYFAAKALAGMLANHDCGGGFDEFARDAYRYADAMLKARGGGA